MKISRSLAPAFIALLACAAQADTLNFGQSGTPTICSTQSNGIGALQNCVQGSYLNQSVGDVAGVLDVVYNAPRIGADSSLVWWNTGYNNLYGVAWAQGNDGNSEARIELRLLAGGSSISLLSLDLGAYFNTSRNTTLTIVDLADNSTVYNSVVTAGMAGNLATTVGFGSLSSTTGLRITWQDSAYNVGIDNIQYTISAVPEPGAWALMAGGLLAIGTLARRRRG